MDPVPDQPPPGVPPVSSRLDPSDRLDGLCRMAGGIAHDFNNHLLAILGNADLLSAELEENSDGSGLLAEIRAGAERAADLCNFLLAFAGQGRFAAEPTDLNEVIGGMVAMLQAAVPRQVILRVHLADELPPVDLDVNRLHQVVMNLVVNAAEAVGASGGEIRLRTLAADGLSPALDHCLLGPDLPVDSSVGFEIEDTGCGMTSAVLERAFEPFFSTKARGRGLGLASVLGILRGHGGALSVRSVEGQGTCVRLRFPVSGRPAAVSRARDVTVPTRNRTVLVVDDEDYLRALCARMLRRLGYRVLTAADGETAVETCRRRRGDVDVVLLDLTMPGLDGVETYDLIRVADLDIPVILSSGYHATEVTHRFGSRGLAGFLQKPYVIDDLAVELGRVLSAARPGGTPDPPPDRD